MDPIIKSFVKESIVAICLFDQDMRIIEASKSFKKMYNITDEHVGKVIYETLHNFPPYWVVAHNSALDGNISEHVEEPYILPNGTTGWHRWQCYPWHTPESELKAIVFTSEDITSRKENELKINSVLERCELIQQAAKIGVWDWDIKGERITLNAEYYELIGWDKDNGLSLDEFNRLIFAEDTHRVKHAMDLALKRERSYDVEFRITRKDDGKLRWLKDKGRVIFDEDGNPTRGYGAIFDVTEQKIRSLELIRSIGVEYEGFMNSMLEGIWAIDNNGITTFVNSAMAGMLGYDIEEMEGSSLFSYMDDEWRKIAIHKFAQRAEGRSERHEFVFRKKDGSAVWCLLGANPIFDNREFVGGVAVVMDFTERKNAELAMQNKINELERLLKELTPKIVSL